MADTIYEHEWTDDRGEVLEEIMSQFGQDILQLAYSYVQNVEIAEELTQEVFIKAYENIHTYKQNSSIRTWLWRIAINHCKDYLKSWHYRKVFVSEVLETNKETNHEEVETIVIQRSEEEILAMSVFHLPIKYREVIYFHYFEELSIKEISFITGINENTIKTRMRRAKELLKKELEGKL